MERKAVMLILLLIAILLLSMFAITPIESQEESQYGDWITAKSHSVEMSIENKTTALGKPLMIIMVAPMGANSGSTQIFDVYLYDSNYSLFSFWSMDKVFALMMTSVSPGYNETLLWNLYHYDRSTGEYTPPPPGDYYLVGVTMGWEDVTPSILIKIDNSTITPIGLAHEEPQPPDGDLWWPYVPSPEQVTLDFWMAGGVAYVNVTIQFGIPCFDIKDWGAVTESNYDIWVDSEIWLWMGFSIQVVPPPISHMYELGHLESGNYTFTFKAWNETVKSIDFMITGYEPVHNIDTGLNYTTIQEAISAPETRDGHTIVVSSGIYNEEEIIVNKQLKLLADGKVIVNGSSTETFIGEGKNVFDITSNNVTLQGFTITNSCFPHSCAGIMLHEVQNCKIIDNTLLYNHFGISLSSNCNNNVIADNMMLDNVAASIAVCYSSSNTIRHNTMIHSSWGILASGCTSSNFTGNTMSGTGGIVIEMNCSNIIINENTLTNNYRGIWIDSSEDNRIFHNNFINNVQQVHIETLGYANFWDDGYPSGGNFWSDYTGVDLYSGPYQNVTGSDGIGDTPYVLDGNNQDNYPLMEPWTPPSQPTEVWVDDDFNETTPSWSVTHFNEIQDGIDAVAIGGTVHVASGTYYEYVSVYKSLTLQGEDGKTTVVDGGGIGVCIHVTASNVAIINFTVRHGNSGIYLEDSNNIRVIGNNATSNTEWGILLYDSINNTLRNNSMSNNEYNFGVGASFGFLALQINNIDTSNTVNGKPVYYLVNQHDLVISPSTFPDVGYLALVNCTNITVENLTLTHNRHGILLDYTNSSVIKNLNVHDNWWGICQVATTNNTIIGNNATNNRWYGIQLYYSNNCTVTANTIKNNGYRGIRAYYSENCTIRENNVSDNDYGIYLIDCDGNMITGNNVTNNDYGIRLHYSSNNTISRNDITANNGDGILLDHSNNNNLSENNIKDNIGRILAGINVHYSSNNTIVGNNITNNYDGIWLVMSSNNNFICRNVITNNGWGIWLEMSSNNSICRNNIAKNWDDGIELWFSSNNSIYHNNFLDNIKQVDSYNSTNVWDNGVEGNYWSNYNGTDINKDGIGDTPYKIDEDNQDNFPLMGMFSDFPVSLEEETYHVTTVCNSTVSAFQFNQEETILSFNVTGPDDTVGFCRIMIPRALINGTCTVLVDGEEVNATVLPISNSTHSFLYFTYSHSTHNVKIFGTIEEAVLIGEGWGRIRIEPRKYVWGRAKLYKIGDEQIKLGISHRGEEYSRVWNIIYYRERKYSETYFCYSHDYGPLIVTIYKRWQFWWCRGRDVLAIGFIKP